MTTDLAAAKALNDSVKFGFAIGGMTCASCVAHVEKALRAAPGVRAASVNLASERAELLLDPKADIAAIAAAVTEEGYEPRLAHFALSLARAQARRRNARLRRRRSQAD